MAFADRYQRQMRLPRFGAEGQRRLRASRVLVVGCGALGTVACEQLCRAGVGAIDIVDRDVVEPSNLQRQTLFTEQDALRREPKAEAAKARLRQINGECTVRAFVDDLHAANMLRYARAADIVLDCLDNFETRYLLNDGSVELGTPLVYAGAVGMRGMAAALLPVTGAGRAASRVVYGNGRATPCLRCLAPEPPMPGEVETCETVGVLGPAAGIAASIEAGLAIRLLAEGADAVPASMVRFDLASLEFRDASIASARDPSCPCCALGERRFLQAMESPWRVLCGRNAVELRLPTATDAAGLDRIAARLGAGSERGTRSVRGALDPSLGATSVQVLLAEVGTLVLVEGTTDPERARSAVAAAVGL